MAESDAFYNELVVEVNSVIAEYGTEYEVRTDGFYNELHMRKELGATRTVRGLIADQQVVNGLSLVDGGDGSALNWTATRTLLLTAASHPQPREKVIIDGREYPLNKLTPIKPADIVVLYLLDVSL